VCDCELAWAGGLFEGEGTIFAATRGRHLSLAMNMTDLDVIERFRDAVDLGKVYGPYENRSSSDDSPRKRFYGWRIPATDCPEALRLLWPWLGERRRARATELGFDPDRFPVETVEVLS
jgi:hypothetical protein